MAARTAGALWLDNLSMMMTLLGESLGDNTRIKYVVRHHRSSACREARARVVLVGDVDSVEAGRPFGQLQDAGMETFKLDEIMRQAKCYTRTAVEAMLARDAGRPSPRSTQASRRASRTRRATPRRRTQGRARICRHAHPPRHHRPRLRQPVPRGTREHLRLRSHPRRSAVDHRRHPPRAAGRRHAGGGRAGRDRPRIARPHPRPGQAGQLLPAQRHRDLPPVQEGARASRQGLPRRCGRHYDRHRRLVPDKSRATTGSQPAGVSTRPRLYRGQARFPRRDRLQFTRNNYRAGRLNGDTAEVAIDPPAPAW